VCVPADPKRALPVAFRGYDRAATDAALATLEQRQLALAAERDELHSRLDRLVLELEEHRRRSQAVADALVTAQLVADDVRAQAEVAIEAERRKVDEERRRIDDEAAGIRAEARQEATEVVREARIRAERLIAEVVEALEAYQRETSQFVTGTSERLAELVGDILGRIPGSAPDYADAEHDGERTAGIAAA
jgi:DivIVA protein